MRFCIWSNVFLTQFAIGVLDLFTFASAQITSSRKPTEPFELPNLSTAQTYMYRRTAFKNLNFWSGESFKSRTRKMCKEEKVRKYRKYVYRRFGLANLKDSNLTSSGQDPEETSAENWLTGLMNTKINGYTLLADMKSLMENFDANVSVSVVAKTVEVHDIVLCKFSKKRRRRNIITRRHPDKFEIEEHKKKIILIVHGLTTMGFRDIPCLYRKASFMKLVHMYAKHLDQFDIYLIPMANPDAIADETLHMWNKNKAPQKTCQGVALDRNFDVRWNKSHGLPSCSQQYPGFSPFSERESRAVADIIQLYSNDIIAYIHVHGGSYTQNEFKGDAVLYPKGYNNDGAENQYEELHARIEESVRNAGFKVYGVTVTNLYNWYGQVSGSSVDYATTVYDIPFGLEFVMQPYSDYHEPRATSEEMQDNVLTEVWKRVIDVVFDIIFKSEHYSDEEH